MIKKNLDISGCDYCNADIILILMNVLKTNKTQVLIGERNVSSAEREEIQRCVNRLTEGEPVQYIINKCEFMSLMFHVEKGVLIPRADTEILVEAVIDRLDKNKKLSVADLCCGSGCVGISIAYYKKNVNLFFYDFSETAIDLTRKNAKSLLDDRKFLITKMDLLSDFPTESFDCVVSNPPYIETSQIGILDKKVKCFEPREALDGGGDGLNFYRRIASEARLNNGGFIAFEIGFNQGDSVAEILSKSGYSDIEVLKDMENRDRVAIGRRFL